MSVDNATDDSSTDSNQQTLYCGHTVADGEPTYGHEVLVCEDCHLDDDRNWFSLDDYPAVLREKTYTVHARDAATATARTTLVAIDDQRRAVYLNVDDGQLWYVVPANSVFHDTEDAIRSSLRDRDVDATYGAPHQPVESFDFHTLPDGDHLALVEVAAAPRDICQWVADNADDLREVNDRYQ